MERKIHAGHCLVQLFDTVEPDSDAALWTGIVGSRVQAAQLAAWVDSLTGGDFELRVTEADRDVFFVDTVSAQADLRKAMGL